MRKPYALINQNGSRPNDQASVEMQIYIFCSQGCNSLPASQHLHVTTTACTRIIQTDACEMFSAPPRGKRTYRTLILAMGL